MAFLCPVRIKRNKKKKPLYDESLAGPAPSMGRITGSASIETLVRVGIEKENGLSPESKMVVLHDFTPCVDDELEVKRGQIVHVLYQENDWVYVISEENREGFIPHSYCAQYGSQLAGLALNVKKKMPRNNNPDNPGLFPGNPPGSLGNPGSNPPGKSTSMNGLPGMSLASPSVPSSGSSTHNNNNNNNNSRSLGSQHMLSSSSQNPLDVTGKSSMKGPDATDSDDNSSSQFQLHSGANLTASVSAEQSRPKSGQSHGQVQGQNQVVDPARSGSLMSDGSSQPDVHPFYKQPSGRFIVLYTYTALDENDLNVERGQCVTVLNSDDQDWYWVQRADRAEGFVPSGFIYPLDAIQRQQGLATKPQPQSQPPQQQTQHKFTAPNQIGASGPPKPEPQFVNKQFNQQALPQVARANHPQSGLDTSQGYHNQQHQPHHSQRMVPPSQAQPHHPYTSTAVPQNQQHSQHGLPLPHSLTQQFQQMATAPSMGSVGSTPSGPSSYSTSGMNSLGIVPPSGSSHSTSGLPTNNNKPVDFSHNSVDPQLQHQTFPQHGLPQQITDGSTPNNNQGGEVRYNGTELVMLYDYKAQAPDDLTVRRGDWVYADLSNQTVDGWLWTYSPKTRKYGFIPKAYARPPAMTSL